MCNLLLARALGDAHGLNLQVPPRARWSWRPGFSPSDFGQVAKGHVLSSSIVQGNLDRWITF